MPKITIHSFTDLDRSGKVRWTACELGYEIEDIRVGLGEHRDEEYLKLNPYAMIPSVVIDGQTWIESTAICIMLAQKHPQAGLIPGDPAQLSKFWQALFLASATLELPVVNYILASRGIVDERWKELAGEGLQAKLEVFAAGVPAEEFLCGTFSIADICAAYVLRIAIQTEHLSNEGKLAAYMNRLRARPAALQSRFFDSL